MKIAILESYAVSSHQRWAEEWAKNSVHEIKIFSLPARHWKWRMHGSAITLFELMQKDPFHPDVLVCTDMLDLGFLRGLFHRTNIRFKVILYFHENQLSYPWSPKDSDAKQKRDQHYAFINYSSALCADEIWFNSDFHRHSFLAALPEFLKQFPDYSNASTIGEITQKSSTMYPGIDQDYFNLAASRSHKTKPLILWNHRWEYDKNPLDFFAAMKYLSDAGFEFDLAVLGEDFEHRPSAFDEARTVLSRHIVHWGFVEDKEQYLLWLQQADLLPVTSFQEFFGYSVLEAIAAGVTPMLPNRLVYPEHLSDQQFYYTTQEELIARLMDLMRRPMDTWPKASEEIKKYSLKSTIDFYDGIISKDEKM